MAKTKKNNSTKQPARSAREERVFQNLLRVVQQFMQGKGFRSATEVELMKRLGLPEQHLENLREILSVLQQQGSLSVSQGQYNWKKEHALIVRGVLRVHPRGFGFLQADNPDLCPKDVFIPKQFTQHAVDGDTVEVEVNTKQVSEKGPEGKVIAILARGRTHLAGIIRAVEDDIVAYAPILGSAHRVVVNASSERDLKVGDRIVMRVLEWGMKDEDTRCELLHYIGHISNPECDYDAAIEEFDLRSDFSFNTIEEANQLGKQVSQKEIKNREDIRDLECFTIDPDTAKDYDDALSLSKDSEGNYQLGVHIADVSHYVRPGTALDQEAKERCNSTYFPGFVLPMLPKELSDNLCSLKPNVNRLTVSVFVNFDQKGDMLNYRIARTVIKSAKRFTYKEAKAVLDGKQSSPHLPTLNLMVELCGLMKRKRHERGSIEFVLPELAVLVDPKGNPVKTEYIEYDITHQLVEEFMLKANEIVAQHLTEQGKNLTYRIHEEPAEENMRDFALLAGAFGFKLSNKPSPEELQLLFEEAVSTPYGPYLATSYIRRMRLASYSPDNVGHYGLGLKHYCHFTSPIRRYVDTVAHRILFGESDDRQELEFIATRCSEQERISSKAENSVTQLKKLRLLLSIQQKEPHKQYEAVVTRVRNYGISFEILDLMLEGYLHVSELDNDFYIYDEAQMCLKGNYRGGRFISGDRITVLLKEIDLILLETSWAFVPEKHLHRTPTKSDLPNKSKKEHHKKKDKQSKAKKKKKHRR